MRRLFMLEDDRDRMRRFRQRVSSTYPDAEIEICRTAPSFIGAYGCLDYNPDLICLDHDLFTDGPEEPDPGDGRDVAKFLAQQNPLCPALIHSTNASAADSMLFTMREAGWLVDRIAPIGEDWIEAFCFPEACRMMASA